MKLGRWCKVHDFSSHHGLICAGCGIPKRGTPARYVFDFWRHVEKTETCWVWKGRVKHDGYGQGDVAWPSRTPHRISFFMSRGYWPKPPNEVDHLCHNRLCVRPEHLAEVTRQENLKRRLCAGKCRKGHVMDEANRITYPSGSRCKTCYEARVSVPRLG